MSQEEPQGRADTGGMSIVQWETFRIRAAALEVAVQWIVHCEYPSTIDAVLEVAETFEWFLRGDVRDETADDEENDDGTEP